MLIFLARRRRCFVLEVDSVVTAGTNGASIVALVYVIVVVVEDTIPSADAPTGIQGAVGFTFCAGLRRAGTKASAAYHSFLIRSRVDGNEMDF
jgi:hypothetical protein